jgi:hypothetical protein
MKRVYRRYISLFTGRRAEADVTREMDAHLALLEDEYRRRRMTADEASLAARRAMGSVALAKDLHRDARTFPWIEDAAGDLRIAVRMLIAAPGFAAVVVLTMALSIGATTTLFSLSYGVLMRPLPWPDAARLVRVFETRGGVDADGYFSSARRQRCHPHADLIIVLRSTGDPAALADDVRAVVRAEDASLPVESVMTMEERVAGSLAGPRTYMVFLGGFALCALVLAGVGLFGVLSHTTAQRTREIGLRTALGAQRADVLRLVSRQAMGITLSGIAGGLVAALVLAQSLAVMLYGVTAGDAISFLVVPLVVMLVSIAACAVPAWRATRIDPIEALRAS